MAKLTDKQIKSLQSIRLNPLADYKKQTERRVRNFAKKIKDTSLSGDMRNQFLGLDEEDDIHFKDDLSNFEHSKLIVSAANRDIIMSLKPTAHYLLFWILFELNYRNDTILLKLEDMSKKGFKLSKNTFKEAISNLEANNIIRRVDNKPKMENYWLFFINPQIIFKGDALNFYKDVLHYHPDYNSQST